MLQAQDGWQHFDFRAEVERMIRKFPDWSDEDIAIAVMGGARDYDELMELMLKTARREVWSARRTVLRRIEQEAEPALRQVETHRSSIAAGNWAIPEELQVLRRETFPLGDGRRVRWGEATVEDHEVRIKRLQRLMGTISRDIVRHQQAVEIIKAAGVRCLDDLKVPLAKSQP